MSILKLTRRHMIGISGIFSVRAESAPGSTGQHQRGSAEDSDPQNAAATNLSAAGIGALLHPRTSAEIAAAVTPVNYVHANGPSRYGASGNNVADDTPAWTSVGLVNGYHFAEDGYYLLHSKVQIGGYVTIVGATRQSTWLISGFSADDYVFEIGARSSGPNPNVGALERLRISGNRGNRGCLHLQNSSHMWRLNDLLLSGGCPALVIDNCWDSNYTNIDILSAGVSGSTIPKSSASIIIRGGSNNLYFRGLRLEASVSGGLFIDESTAIRIVDGKIDNGFGPGQGAPSITVTESGELYLREFYIGGQYTYQAHVAGAFICDDVTFDGGSGQPAAIYDCRPWIHVDTKLSPGISRPSIGPALSRLDLGRSTFNRTHPSVNTTTPAAVYSKIFPVRILNHLGVTANGAVQAGAITVATNAEIMRNDQYTGCYLVHNPTGTRWDSRRRILSCFIGGQMTVAGTLPLPLDSDWSIEYCAGHYTPILARDIRLQNGAALFAQPCSVTITGTPRYDAVTASPTFGMTRLTIAKSTAALPEDLTGLYFIDDHGEPFLIGYGADSAMCVGVLYDRTERLRPGLVLTVQAGYSADIQKSGSSLEWTYASKLKHCLAASAQAAGFDIDNLPLWGPDTGDNSDAREIGGPPTYLPLSSAMTPDGSVGRDFVIDVDRAVSFTIHTPVNLRSGERLLFTIRNVTEGPLEAIAWQNYKMAAWISPAPGNNRSIEFRFDGEYLTEINRTAGDVPN